ncbi:galactitol-1-phosphate 5-dehydrogenase [Deltaproteobacteria bacterium]|nr:galactitol-1-phosphate 5-dehydrogenase [Deltaproteobacteria bacterium]
MKAVQFTAPEQIMIAEVPIPEIADNEVLAKVAFAGFCATDIDLLTGNMVHIKNGFTTYPLIPGHEWSGVIEKVGKNVLDFKVGDRVTSDVSLGCGECEMCRLGRYNLCPNRFVIGTYRNRQGVFAEYVAAPQRHLYKIPDALSLEEAALAEPAATAAYAVKRAGIKMADSVMVIGDGPIGQLAAQLARLNGAAKIIVVGSWDEKLKIALECGANVTLNYHRDEVVSGALEATNGRGPDVIIESSGNKIAPNLAIKALRPGGTIVFISWYPDVEVPVQMNNAIAKDCNIVGALASPNCFSQVLTYMARGLLKTAPLITHIEPIEKIAEIITMIRAKKSYRNKILFKLGA